jgi:integrase
VVFPRPVATTMLDRPSVVVTKPSCRELRRERMNGCKDVIYIYEAQFCTGKATGSEEVSLFVNRIGRRQGALHHAVQEAERALFGRGYRYNDLVFPKPDGSPWTPSQFSSDFSRLARRQGFKLRFHDLRHTHASQLLEAGVPVKVVSERLGHASASITLDSYSHVLPGMQEVAVAKTDAAFGAAPAE